MASELGKDQGATPRAISAELLGDDSSVDSRDALQQALGDKSWVVRAAVAAALGNHGSRSDIATLAPLLDDGNYNVRLQAAAAIMRLPER